MHTLSLKSRNLKDFESLRFNAFRMCEILNCVKKIVDYQSNNNVLRIIVKFINRLLKHDLVMYRV